MKGVIAVFLSIIMLLPCIASAEMMPEPNSIEIEPSYSVMNAITLEKLNKNKEITYTKIDLRPFANRAYADDVAGDKKGGWSDQGPDNDMRQFKMYGDVEVLGIPFDIIPEGENNNKTVVGLRGQNDMGIPNKIEIPVNSHAAGMYIIHSAPYGSKNKLCGRYSFKYADGTYSYMNIISTKQVNDFWGERDAEYAKCVWIGENTYASQNRSRIHLTMLPMINPYPEKKIDKIILETEGSSSYLMILGITLTSEGPYWPDENELNIDESGWKASEVRNYEAAAGSAIDVSYLLDAPAGKHGAVLAQDDEFIFEDGTSARFWGTNLVGIANFPDKSNAEKLAQALAQNGINLVRMTQIDKYIFGGENTLNIDNDKMDNLCYFIKCLKEKGIYVYLTMTSVRKPFVGDGIANIDDTADGYKIEGFYDEILINLQKEYISKFLGWFNPYTGLKICQDPCIAMIEFLDSNSMFAINSRVNDEFGISSEEYKSELDKKFDNFISEKYRTDYQLKKVWKSDYDFISGKGLGGLVFYSEYENSLFSQQHKYDTAEFLMKVQQNYYDEMKEHIKSIGYRGVTTCSSNPVNFFTYGDALAGVTSDFTAKNGISFISPSSKETSSVVCDEGLGYLDDFVKARVQGRPYVLSAWGTSYASPFSADSILSTAAISAQQGWSACQYAFLNDTPFTDNIEANDTLTSAVDSARLGLMPAAAILYNSLETLDDEKVFNISIKNTIGENAFRENSSLHLFDTKVSTAFSDSQSVEYFNPEINKYSNDNFVFDPNEGIYGVRNDTTEAFVGKLSECEQQEHIDMFVDNVYSAVVLSALDNKTFDDANRFLLTTVARTRNDGMTFDDWNNVLVWGTEALTEPVTGKFTLKIGECRVYALDFSGRRIAEIPTIINEQGDVTFEVQSDSAATYYEIVR